MTRRLQAIVLLLRSLDWFEPQPETSTGNLVRRGSKPGEGPSMKIDCGVCHGSGEIRKRGMPAPCPVLGCRNGKIVVDAYTGRQIATEGAPVRSETKAVSCAFCAGQRKLGNGKTCIVCRGSGVQELTLQQWQATHGHGPAPLSADVDFGGAGDPVSAAIDRRDALGSYWELGLALGALRLDLPRAYRLLVRVEVERSVSITTLDETRLRMREIALCYLERLMPAEILVPAGVRIAERNRKARERIAARRQGEESAA